MIKVLFVCLGNICRSPMAQFVFKQMVEERGLADQFEIDSAATESYNEMCHAGIHHGTREMLKSMHVPFEEHYSRRIRPHDYAYYDYILAMDDSNIEDIQSLVGPDTETKSTACLILLTTRATFAILGIPAILTRVIGILLRAVRRF